MGRFFLRYFSISLFLLIILTLLGVLIGNLFIVLKRDTGLIQENNIAVHFSMSLVFICCEIICFSIASRFFTNDTLEILVEEETTGEHTFRAYLFVNSVALLSFLSYLVLVQQEFYIQAYWAIFITAFSFLFAHLRTTFFMHELSNGIILHPRFKIYPFYFIYFGISSFIGVVSLIVNTLVLADQK